ncbi:MAG: glutathione peroxidase [Aureispira sp.]|jgi:glutathione peroxidase
MNTPQSIHNLSIKGLNGAKIKFSDYAGKKILLVNVASECGLTPQYAQLEEMYREFSDKFVIVGCPANNFGAQEPGTDAEIQQFCTLKYDVSFPLTTKISVKGSDKHDLYRFVTEKVQNGVQDSEVSWNFQKYVFDEQGFLSHIFEPQSEPASDEILTALGLSA